MTLAKNKYSRDTEVLIFLIPKEFFKLINVSHVFTVVEIYLWKSWILRQESICANSFSPYIYISRLLEQSMWYQKFTLNGVDIIVIAAMLLSSTLLS